MITREAVREFLRGRSNNTVLEVMVAARNSTMSRFYKAFMLEIGAEGTERAVRRYNNAVIIEQEAQKTWWKNWALEKINSVKSSASSWMRKAII